MHLREAIVAEDDGGASATITTTTVLCRYNRSGDCSILYLAVDQLYDALFELHSLELSHRGRDATKAMADERYANVPDATIRAFLDTCPICAVRRGGHHGRTTMDAFTATSNFEGMVGHHFDRPSLVGLRDSM